MYIKIERVLDKVLVYGVGPVSLVFCWKRSCVSAVIILARHFKTANQIGVFHQNFNIMVDKRPGTT